MRGIKHPIQLIRRTMDNMNEESDATSTRSSDDDDNNSDDGTEDSGASFSNDEGEGSQMDTTPANEFDRRLTVAHSYLGNTELGELSSESIFEEPGNKIKVPILIMNDICLLPGQATPLKFHTQPSVQFLTDPSRQRSFFALLTNDQDVEMESAEDFSRVHCHPIGTLFQLQNALKKREDSMTIQVVGRQRCALTVPLYRHNIHCEDISSLLIDKVEVQVLEDQLLPKQIFPMQEECSVNRLSEKERFNFFAALSPLSVFALRQCSTNGVVQKLVTWLLYWFKRRQIDLVIEQGLTMFSFWVAANIPMSLEKKLELLAENSSDRRLRMEWQIVAQMTSIVCNDCSHPKCDVSEVINLSVEGNSTHFVNPGGFVHDLFTVKRLDGVDRRGLPSSEFSWFPGYDWTIIECSNCFNHIGWHFSSKYSLPREFYGISRRSFRLACVKESLE